MFSDAPKSRRLVCVYKGILLGLAAAIIYMGFLLTHLHRSSEPMVLIPIEVATSSRAGK